MAPTLDDVRRKARVALILRAERGRRGSGERLKRYWLTEGLHRWATKRHPWRTLRRLLLQKTKNPNLATRLATELVHAHFGLYPGHDAYRLMHGGKIRGKRIGPG